MHIARHKELLRRFSPAAMAATLLLALVGTPHAAHAASSSAVACPPASAAHKAVKHVASKHRHLGHRRHAVAKRQPVVVRIAEAPAQGYRVLVSADYQRIIPEQNCNMEPAWAVPACLQRLMRTSLE